mmetsp:Transcript_64907/g.125259  ORF Transcript_64907/g.125259 Transcript_64907/m.125259 type:complete len:196 (-) Transcript_64907:86-673(-)
MARQAFPRQHWKAEGLFSSALASLQPHQLCRLKQTKLTRTTVSVFNSGTQTASRSQTTRFSMCFFRDIVEPLESLGLKVTPTKRKSLEEIGDAMAVGKKLVADTIPTGAPNEIITAKSKEDALGRRYDIIEFRYQWYFEEELARQLGRQRFQLHQKALIQIYNKKQYLLLVSIEEPRWEIKSDQMLQAIDTWKLI